jgi:spore maturation protein SpmB
MKTNRIHRHTAWVLMGSMALPAFALTLWFGTLDLKTLHPNIHRALVIWCIAVLITLLIYLIRTRVTKDAT